MNKKSLFITSVLAVSMLAGCGLFKVKKTGTSTPSEGSVESGGINSDVIPATFDTTTIINNLKNMTSFSLTGTEKKDYKFNGSLKSSGQAIDQTVKSTSSTTVDIEGETYFLTGQSEKRTTISAEALAQAFGITVDQLPDYKTTIENYLRCTIEINQTAGTVTLNDDSAPYQMGQGYDSDAKQWYSFMYSDNYRSSGYILESERRKENRSMADYLLDGIDGFIDGIKDGTYDSSTGKITKNAEAGHPIQFDSDTYVTKIVATVRDNYIVEMKADVDVAASTGQTILQSGENYIEYKFSNINTKHVTLPVTEVGCKNGKHHEAVYECLPEGHRQYCSECYKYLSELENHDCSHNDHNLCEICIGIPDLEPYENPELTSADGDPYLEVQVSKSTHEIIGGSYAYGDDFDYYSESTSEGYWYCYFNEFEGAAIEIISPTGTPAYFIEGHCATSETYTYKIYKGITFVEGSDGAADTYNGKESLKAACAEITPIVVEVIDYDVNHYEESEDVQAVDNCHTKHTYTCTRCHQITKTKITHNHTRPVWSLITKEDLPFATTFSFGAYLKMECLECHETLYYGAYTSGGLSTTHDTDGLWLRSFDKDGNRLDEGNVKIPHVEDENGYCIFCRMKHVVVGNLSFEVSLHYEGQADQYMIISYPTLVEGDGYVSIMTDVDNSGVDSTTNKYVVRYYCVNSANNEVIAQIECYYNVADPNDDDAKIVKVVLTSVAGSETLEFSTINTRF